MIPRDILLYPDEEKGRSQQLNKPKTVDKVISDIVGVFTDPIVVFPGGWGDSLPDWLKGAVTLERLEMNMKALKGEEMTGTDAEACAYLIRHKNLGLDT